MTLSQLFKKKTVSSVCLQAESYTTRKISQNLIKYYKHFKSLNFSDRRMSVAGHKLYVGNLDRHVESKDLYDSFEKFGKVERVFMKEGYAFVHMVDERDADDARRDMDGRYIQEPIKFLAI